MVTNPEDKLRIRGETHWCFPNFGPVPEGFYPKYPKHGFVRNTILYPTEIAEGYAKFTGTENLWGIQTIGVGISVNPKGVTTWMTAVNHESKPLAILPALHPYFATPREGLAIMVGNTMVAGVVGSKPHGISRLSQVIPRHDNLWIQLYGIGRVEIELPDHSRYFTLWSDNPSEYVCVEPMFEKPGTFGTPEGAWLGPNDQTFCEVHFRFTAA